MSTNRARNISPADRAAADRLKSLWLSIPRERRPTQQALAEQWTGDGEANQSLISQYMTGKIALNYRAVLFFAQALGVEPERIRDDLPEQILTANTVQPAVGPASQSVLLDPDTIRAAHELIRGAYQDGGKVYSIEAEPDLFAIVYAKLHQLKGQQSMANVASIVREIDRHVDGGRDHGTGGRDERTGGATTRAGTKRAAS